MSDKQTFIALMENGELGMGNGGANPADLFD